MDSLDSAIRSRRRIEKIRTLAHLLLLIVAFSTSGVAGAEGDERGDDESFWYAISHGKPTLDMRLRVEIADAELRATGATGLNRSEAYTLRTRLGYGTRSWRGVMVYAEAENTTAVATNEYDNATEGGGTGQTVIADPTNTEVNQAFFKLDREDWLGSSVILGRQRIILDDSRFVGNVGWRQNEQTYDAVRGRTTLGLEGLDLTYAYLRYARRIFGDQGGLPTRDWRSNSHIVNASYSGLDFVDLTAFAYLLEFNRSAGNSSASVGLRLTGSPRITDELELVYELSYAYQTDFANNPVSYDAHYFMGQLNLARDDVGSLGIGYELLGSDDGMARFVTPLATAHKFNGWADVFLDNGGTDGLQDLFGMFSPAIPYGFSGSLIYHHFWSDHGSDSLGDEIDFVLKRPINEYLGLLLKSAYFNSSDRSRPNLWRVSLQATLAL